MPLAKLTLYVRKWMLLKGFMKENNMIELCNFRGLHYDIVLNGTFLFMLQFLNNKHHP